MFTQTKKKTKTSRWQALVLAALVLMSGSIAMPQAADAATVKSSSKECRSSAATCILKVKARNDVYFRVAATSDGTSRYTVRTPGGRLLCRGTITLNHGNRSCWFGTYTGPVAITVSKEWSTFIRIHASY